VLCEPERVALAVADSNAVSLANADPNSVALPKPNAVCFTEPVSKRVAAADFVPDGVKFTIPESEPVTFFKPKSILFPVQLSEHLFFSLTVADEEPNAEYKSDGVAESVADS
jgi:hypothetical protein